MVFKMKNKIRIQFYILTSLFLLLPSFAMADQTISFGGPSSDGQQIGSATGARLWAWHFTPSINSTSIEVSACIASLGSNSDGVTIELLTDSGGNPGSVIDSFTVDNANLFCGSGDPAVDYGTLTGSLTSGTQYWIGFRRSNATSNSDSNRYYIYGDYPGTHEVWVGLTDDWADSFQDNDRDFDGNIVLVASGGGGGGGGGSNLGQLLLDANEGYGNTTGFNVGAAVAWSGDNFIGLFIGSMLGALLALKYWIAASLILAAVIFFSMRAFVFFRH